MLAHLLFFQLLALTVDIADAQGPAIGGNHSAATIPFWQQYNYCQGRNIIPGTTWQPLQNAKMIKLQVLHRHGARSPALGVVPGDQTQWYQCGNPDEFVFMNQGDSLSANRSPYMKEQVVIDGAFAYTLWKGNCDIGELTSFGSRQLQQLGQLLRTVYVDTLKFLPAQMAQNFRIRHTSIWRTRESVENLFEGLYPLSTRPANATLTMHVKPSQIETIVSPASACPKLANLTASYAASPAYASTLAPHGYIQNKLVSAYNTTGIAGFNTTQTLYDTASCTYCHGLGLRGNLTVDDIQVATIAGTSVYHNLFRQNPNAEQVKRLAMGAWLQDILTSFNDTSSPLEVYSAHDASLDMFLSIVADPDMPWPAFASNVLVELWQQSNGTSVVRMYYEGMVVPAHPELRCSLAACPLSTLRAFMQRYIPGDFQAECRL